MIEDEPDILAGIAEALEYEGYTVEVATNGLDGLERARAFRPDLEP